MVNEKMEVPVSLEDIDVAHRLGKFNNAKPRAIICKFTHRLHKASVIQQRRKLKGTRIGIVEDLTMTNKILLGKVKETSCVKIAWTYGTNGKICALLTNDKKIKITHNMSLQPDDLLRASHQRLYIQTYISYAKYT